MQKVLFHGAAKLHQSVTDEEIDCPVRVACSQGVKSVIHKYFKNLGSYRRLECFPFKRVKCVPTLLIQVECVLLLFEVLNVFLQMKWEQTNCTLQLTCFYPNTDLLRTISVCVCVLFPSVIMQCLWLKLSNHSLELPIIPFNIVRYPFTLLQDNLSRNSCTCI